MKHIIPRRSDRTRFLIGVDVRSQSGGGNSFKANVIDLAESGLALFAKRFVAVGQTVELAFPSGNGASATADGLRILGSVANARIESDGNILGIAFARTLSSSEIETLKSKRGCGSRR